VFQREAAEGVSRPAGEAGVGSYQRQLPTKVGEVTLKVPKLCTLPFETVIIERYRRHESPTKTLGSPEGAGAL
jgi:transposase-like protein